MQSKDRVKFQLPYCQISKMGMATVLRSAFRIDDSSYSQLLHDAGVWDGVTIICRPSQFARFLIYRNEAGITNSFKELSPILFTPQPKPRIPEPLDVSGASA